MWKDYTNILIPHLILLKYNKEMITSCPIFSADWCMRKFESHMRQNVRVLLMAAKASIEDKDERQAKNVEHSYALCADAHWPFS